MAIVHRPVPMEKMVKMICHLLHLLLTNWPISRLSLSVNTSLESGRKKGGNLACATIHPRYDAQFAVHFQSSYLFASGLQAFKFFMEQHVENLLKSHQQRMERRMQLETEMKKIGLSEEAQCQMRRMLSQKESNYIRLKRAKMNKAMFLKIKGDTQHL